ncbi:iron(III) dicitrate-binding periplasmic protein [Synechocystis sp. PCC 6803]|uniref:Iron(III) dicitrate-binding periplasmic protein n=2 Tax=Synechocystis TaxID=1142 RepID=P72611_SYNY3|nr:iron(III) dicitrate-binding periplasmic protein [Synechocystis sp. PCC 6803]AVP91160.1 iron-siderophore ABC transporter substrate-binding protein [Synechocystis sp. IPPAS B-1465]MBD2619624.1 iron-siderophore ABC transporter substrate-binding protein [Synechocystis sp. FACHB-898]MBD2640360.1 iron-siderophore ABC transporter substrate-binding protein [Synechocystis sp. FACHB-908]MBD2662323.1 iron-siderophore ABC transporter substrate-binding protein [Synechocystis sp. FACHB-929]BAL27780.1 iro
MLVVACQNPSQREAVKNSEDCVIVNQPEDQACVPKTIDRLVTLDGAAFEYAIALGLEPIATVPSNFQAQLPALMTNAENIQNIGKGEQPNLEAILGTNPDLIVGLDSHQSIYPQLSQIGPTVLFPFEHSGQWKEVFASVGNALHRQAATQSALAAYQARSTDFRTQMGDRLDNLQVSVIRLYPDGINLYLKDSFAGTVLQDAGLARPPSQNISAVEAQQKFGNPIQTRISREVLEQADGDVIFLWTGENTPQGNEEAKKRLQQLQQDPLWGQLRAVKAGKVYEVPSYWIGSGPIAANAILDDLYKYLLGEN